MALQSQLFRFDPKLESAAVSDEAHIAPGATGPHVGKIQLALKMLDRAAIAQDSVYGLATAAAVLAYKQKRNIVNRSYQAKADNIVGKMTIDALDAEMLRAEADNARPRIVAVYPTNSLSNRSSPVPQFRPAEQQTRSLKGGMGILLSEWGAKTVAGPTPKIDFPGSVPGSLFQDMELQEHAFGSFQVIDGIGGTVACLTDSVGRVFDPAEPLAHGGTMWVTKSPQAFRVLARGVGRTFIEAKPAGKSPFSSFITLVVVAPSTKLTWRPQWTPRIANPAVTCNFWASRAFGSEVPGVKLKAPWIEFTGIVDPDATVLPGDFELGILQTMIYSKMTANYVDAGGRPAWVFTIGGPAFPCRDAADDSPVWYDKTAVKLLNAADGKKVESSDGPENVLPWQTKDKKGTLVSSSGSDLFCTWLAARQKSTGTFTFLCWAKWAVDWACTFDFKSQKGTPTGQGEITGQGDDGQGPATPVTSGKTAIQQTTMTWTGPAGGY